MDPQATWDEIKACLRELDDYRSEQNRFIEDFRRAEAITALRNLANWLERGGFGPRSI